MDKFIIPTDNLVDVFCDEMLRGGFRGNPSREERAWIAHHMVWAGIAELTLPAQRSPVPEIQQEQQEVLLESYKVLEGAVQKILGLSNEPTEANQPADASPSSGHVGPHTEATPPGASASPPETNADAPVRTAIQNGVSNQGPSAEASQSPSGSPGSDPADANLGVAPAAPITSPPKTHAAPVVLTREQARMAFFGYARQLAGHAGQSAGLIPAMEPQSQWNRRMAPRCQYPAPARIGVEKVLGSFQIGGEHEVGLFTAMCALRGAMVLGHMLIANKRRAVAIIEGEQMHALPAALKDKSPDGSALLEMLLRENHRLPCPKPELVVSEVCRRLYFDGRPSENELKRLVIYVTWTGICESTDERADLLAQIGNVEALGISKLRGARAAQQKDNPSGRAVRTLRQAQWADVFLAAAGVAPAEAGKEIQLPHLTVNSVWNKLDRPIEAKRQPAQVAQFLASKLKQVDLPDKPRNLTLLRTILGVKGAITANFYERERIDLILAGTTVHQLAYEPKKN